MQRLTVYSSAPVGSRLACAFQNLHRAGLEIVMQPLSALPAVAQPPRRRSALRDDLEEVTQRLVAIGSQLDAHQTGQHRLNAGTENGLLAERDALQSRQRGILAALQTQKGGA